MTDKEEYVKNYLEEEEKKFQNGMNNLRKKAGENWAISKLANLSHKLCLEYNIITEEFYKKHEEELVNIVRSLPVGYLFRYYNPFADIKNEEIEFCEIWQLFRERHGDLLSESRFYSVDGSCLYKRI